MSANDEDQAARPVATLKNPAKRIKYTEQPFPQDAATKSISAPHSSENTAPFVTRVTASGPALPEKDGDARSPEDTTTSPAAAASDTPQTSMAEASAGVTSPQGPTGDAATSASATSAEEQDGNGSAEPASVSTESDGR